MGTLFCKIRGLACCLAASIAVHLLVMYAVRISGPCDFTAPVNMARGILVELAVASANPEIPVNSVRQRVGLSGADLKNLPATVKAGKSQLSVSRQVPLFEPETEKISAVVTARDEPATTGGKLPSDDSPQAHYPEPISFPVSAPLKSSTFLTSKYEKLTYVISMFGAPVGNAELEATAADGQVLITLRVRSNDAFSAIYPVDNLVETRHVDGRYIMTRIRQREGPFRNDALFTINLLKKRITWVEPLNGNSRQVIAPDDDLLDTLSGIYYLRNRHLSIGQTETVNIFDSQTYAAVPVEILRREELRLANLSEVDTLVVHPLQKTAGIFRHSGDVLIWLTNDSYKVPVKIVTSFALGRITAELVSVDSKSSDGEIRTASP